MTMPARSESLGGSGPEKERLCLPGGHSPSGSEEADKEEEDEIKVASDSSSSSMDSADKNGVQPCKFRLWLAALSASSCGVSFGAALVHSTTLLPALEDEDDPSVRMTLEEGSWLVMTLVISGLIGSLIGGIIADLLGRRIVLLLFQLPILVSWVLIAMAPSHSYIFVARALAGISDGAHFSLAVVYLGEISPAGQRGAVMNVINVLQNVGIVTGYVLGSALPWRTASWVMLAPNLLSAALMFFFSPETAFYLVSVDREREAAEALRRVRGPVYDVTDEISEIKARKMKLREEKQHDGKSKVSIICRTLCSLRFLKPFCAIAVPYCIVQLSGASTMSMYLVNIFQAFGTPLNPYLLTISVGLVKLLCSMLSMWTLHRFPRRALLFLSVAFMALFQVLLGTSYFLKSSYGLSDESLLLNWSPVLCLCGYYVSFSLGTECVIRILCGEVFPTDVRSVANGITLVLAQAAIGLSGYLYPVSMDLIDFHGTFWAYAAVTVVVGVYCFFSVPESKGKSLVNIEEHYDKK